MDEAALYSLFATPTIYIPHQSPEEIQASVDQMFARSKATQRFIEGKISPEEFCEVLNDHAIDPYACLNDWENGQTYL